MASVVPSKRKAAAPIGAWLVAGAGIAFTLFYTAGLIVRPSDAYIRFQSNWIYQVAPLAALLLSVVAIRRSHGRERLGWLALAFVLITWGIGDWMYTYYDVRYQDSPPFPGLADVVYFAGYAGFLAVIALLAYPRQKVGDARWLVDAAIVLVATGTLSWVYLVHPIIATGGYSPFSAAVALGYPLFDFVMLALLIISLFAAGGRLRLRTALLALSVAVLVIADGGYTYLVTTVGYENIGNPLDPLWIASYVLMAVCFVLPEEAPLEGSGVRQSPLGMAIPYLVTIPMVGLLIYDQASGGGSTMLLIGTMVTCGLIVARQFMTLRENVLLYNRLEREAAGRRALLDRLVTAQEDERHRLALDIHDRPVQSLSFLATRLASARKFSERGDAQRAQTILGEVEQGLATEVKGLRYLMMDLRPPSLEERGLPSALSDLVRDAAAQSGIPITFEASGEMRAPATTEAMIYRIAQEALTNVRRHAEASSAEVRLSAGSDELVLTVVDDGVGLELSGRPELVATGHFGLLGIIERTELIGGDCAWRRQTPRGTCFTLRVPVQAVQQEAA